MSHYNNIHNSTVRTTAFTLAIPEENTINNTITKYTTKAATATIMPVPEEKLTTCIVAFTT
jgi:hypothetical protein